MKHPSSGSRRRRRASGRGAVGIVTIAALVIVEMVIVVAVLGGGFQHDLTVQRIATNRAFYAAEAGSAIAIRELWLGRDEDGDGTIGGVSDDGNEANDPTFAGAVVAVSISEAEGEFTLVASGRSGLARRCVEILVGR